jgi:transcriptional regulatory protein GAL4
VQSKLHQAINPVYHRLISTPPPGSHELLSLQKPIDDWEASIPPYFQLDNPAVHQHDALILARYRLTWRAANIRIILYRPIVLKWAARRWTAQDIPEAEDPEEEQCRQLCLQSARETIASISQYMTTNIPSRLGSWYMLLVAPSRTLSGLLTSIVYTVRNTDSCNIVTSSSRLDSFQLSS